MPTVHVPAQLDVEHLMMAVKKLSPSELSKFKRQFVEWQKGNGGHAVAEAALIKEAKARMPITSERRLKSLIAKSERGTLTPKELVEYRTLAQQAERLDVQRVEALAELVRRRGKCTRVAPIIPKSSARGDRYDG